MRKLTLVILIAVMALSGACATKSQETVATGAGVGAVIGGVLGYIVGGRTGAAIGAAIGAGAGALVGNEVDSEQKKYATQEQWLDAQIAQTNNLNQRALAHNKSMEKKLAEMRFEEKRMRALARQNKLQAGQLAKEKAKLNTEQESTKALLAQVTKEVEKTQYILEKKKIKSDQQKQQLVASLKTMQQRQQELKSQLEVLASLPINTM
ncbi:MAG: glycine zipper 2TM domain-containing protein [Proteobacteria bacterium]|nr:glycine zipper 2TM domain-containing protein [Pseudomonadota bacterium]